MKVLYINTYNPETEQHGGAAVTRSELKALRSRAEVRTLFGAPLSIRRHQLSPVRLALDVLRGDSLKLASYRVLHQDASFYRGIDLVWCNHDFSAYDYRIFKALRIPYIVRKHNAEHRLISGQHWPGRVERRRIARFEECIARSAATTFHISSSECRVDTSSSRKAWLPPLLEDPLKFLARESHYDWATRPVDLLCVSNFDWPPNKEGIEWFLAGVLEKLPQDFRLHLVGVGSERYQQDGRVISHGFVPDLQELLHSSKVFVAPVLSGAGVKIKNVTALAAGLPLVTTSVGIDGIQEPGDVAVACVADTAEDFAAAINRLLADQAACAAMSHGSHAWARQHIISSEAWLSAAVSAMEAALS